MWINVWVAGTVNAERFRDEYHTHYKALCKCPAYLLTYTEA